MSETEGASTLERQDTTSSNVSVMDADVVSSSDQQPLEKDEGSQQLAASDEVLTMFSVIQKSFESEQDKRESIRVAVRDLEQTARTIYTTMQAMHQCPREDLPQLCTKGRATFELVRNHFDVLKSLIPRNDYYRYHDHWRFVTQRLSFLASLIIYLESGDLAKREQVAQVLGVCVNQEEGFHIDLEDFLMGLLTMCNELSRLAVNSVILEDFKRPFEISAFISDLTSGFRLLNLKNDGLRKKFDSLKYDLKKVEEVVYDISIRGLKPTT